MEKKKFRDTKVGQWLNKAKDKLPELAGIGMEILQGDIGGAIEKVQDLLDKKAQYNTEAQKLLQEWEKYKMEFQKELIEMDNADRADARAREVSYVQATGGRDWFQFTVGCVGLVLMGFVVYVAVYLTPENPDTFNHTLGLVEGVALSIFTYYFGSSAGSKQKSQTIEKLKE